MRLGTLLAPLVSVAGAPIGQVLSVALGFARPIAEPAISIYGRLSPQADRELLARPEFRAMFLDDLLHGGSRRMNAPFADVVVFARDWGFRVGDVTVPVRWWHGDADHIIPYAHGEHMVFARKVLEEKAKADERFARRFSEIVEKHDKNLYSGS